MKVLTGLVFLLLTALSSAAQVSNEKLAEQLHNFEANWLSANLNSDQQWKQRFTDGKLAVVPADRSSLDTRALDVSSILDPTLAANEIKVRITGTITLITNNHLKDRSFRFLDTFNRKDGKWEMIATGLAPTNESSAGIDKRSVETQLTDLENTLATAGNHRSVVESMIASDFVGTTADGKVHDRMDWLRSMETQKFKAKIDDIAIHLVSDTVAVITGIDTSTKTDEKASEVVSKERITHTWLNRNGNWQLLASQATELR
jgi:hypothetical protein